jgi:hypothetical protein
MGATRWTRRLRLQPFGRSKICDEESADRKGEYPESRKRSPNTIHP